VKKTLRIALLLSALSVSTAPLFATAAPTGGDPRPQVSFWSQMVAVAHAFLGI
jgi:hypothetical protein